MAQLLIVAHAPLASSLQVVARHTYPDCSRRLAVVDVQPESTLQEAEQQVRAALEALGDQEVLVLADVFGATPCNAAAAAVDGVRSRVVAGVNVPMLWRTLCYADKPLDDLIELAKVGGKEGTMHVSVARRQNQTTQSASHDQVQHHHQQ